MISNPLRSDLPPGVIGIQQFGPVTIEIVHGDLTEETTDSIVNPANEQLQHAGGLAAAIVRKGGEIIQIESDRIGHVPTGEAVVTGAGKLPSKFIIHAVGPVWRGGGANEEELLASAVRASLLRANELGLESVAIPAISCGIFSFPPARAAGIIIRTIRIFCEVVETTLKTVRCTMLEKDMAELFGGVLRNNP